MFCDKCGASIKDGALFCAVCGNRGSGARKSDLDVEKIENTAISFKNSIKNCVELCRTLSADCENSDATSRKKKIYTGLSKELDAMGSCINRIYKAITELKGIAESSPSENNVHLIKSFCMEMADKLKDYGNSIKELMVLGIIEGVELPCKKEAESAIAQIDDFCRMIFSFLETVLREIELNLGKSALNGHFSDLGNDCDINAPKPSVSCAAPRTTAKRTIAKTGMKGAPERGIRGLFSIFRKGKDNQPETLSIPANLFAETDAVSSNSALPTQQLNSTAGIDSFVLTDVLFSAIVQKEVSRDEYMSLDIVMYEDDFRKIVEEKLDETTKEVKKHFYGIAGQSRIKVVLTAKGAEVDNPVEEYVWQGRYLEFSFLAYVPGDYTGKQISFCATVYANDIIATRLNIIVGVNENGASTTELRRDDINTAFISYSSADRIRVTSIIQGMQKMRPDLDVFMDVESLRSGEDWQSKLQNEIDKRDVFYLCWSKAAKESKWVEFEWRYALEKKGEEWIEPLPIDPTELCEPPKELGKKHFNDKMVYLVKALEYMSNKTPYINVCENGIYKKICINKDEFILGRDKTGTDYSINNPKVSRCHAKIIKDKERYYIIDLGSVNKTFVDGEECVPGKMMPVGNGSLLRLADEEITFELV